MSRHKNLASAMSAIMAYRNRPEGEPVPVKTNWSVVAANDNEPEIVTEMPIDRKRLVTPSVAMIMKQIETNYVERNADGLVVRIGNLRFSDGTQVERGFRRGPDGIVPKSIIMPVGAMLGCRDKLDISLGGQENASEITASNNYFADAFGVRLGRRKKGGKRRSGPGMRHDQAKNELARAYANTNDLPTVKHCAPGLPLAGNKVADSFLGMKKLTKGNSGSIGWEDICTALVDREIWAEALDGLQERDRRTIDAAMTARTMKDFAVGKKGGNAYVAGQARIRAANDNLSQALKKSA